MFVLCFGWHVRPTVSEFTLFVISAVTVFVCSCILGIYVTLIYIIYIEFIAAVPNTHHTCTQKCYPRKAFKSCVVQKNKL